jgi:transcriptional regulator with XRE-family HTH domain
LKSVSVCLKHQQYLQQVCPHCHCSNLPLAWNSRPGHCYKCLKWLGSSSVNEQTFIPESELIWRTWITETVGELIAATSSLHIPLDKQQVARLLKNYVNITAGGNIAEFSRQIQMPRNTVWLWCEGKNQPQLEALLKLCYCLNISLLSLLTQQANETQLSPLQPPIATKVTSRAEAKSLDLVMLAGMLQDILLNHECPPPSMGAVAKRLKLNRRTILGHFPEMCHAISAKYIFYRRAKKLSTIEQCRQEVRQAVINLYNQNIYPSEARISKLLTKPGFLRYTEVREMIDQTKADLGVRSSL